MTVKVYTSRSLGRRFRYCIRGRKKDRGLKRHLHASRAKRVDRHNIRNSTFDLSLPFHADNVPRTYMFASQTATSLLLQLLLHWQSLQGLLRERIKRHCTFIACVEASGTATPPAWIPQATSPAQLPSMYRFLARLLHHMPIAVVRTYILCRYAVSHFGWTICMPLMYT